MRLASVLLSLVLAIGGPGALDRSADEQSGEWVGQFGDATLDVGGQRLLEGARSRSGSPEGDWAALWSAYLDSLYEACMAAAVPGLERCAVLLATGPGVTPATAELRPITMADLAQFRPIVGELVVEPHGWGVVGTPTNFYATAETHTMAGELFDMPIEVRWAPSSYVFDYGDGTTESSEASGTAWRGTEESWTETATSHVYAERSDVTASLTVVFTAEVDAGGGWFAVPGTLPVAAPSVGVKVFEVDTVLTNGDCMVNPSAAGCG